MNVNCDLPIPRVTHGTAFEARPSCASSRPAEDSELEKLKSRLLRQTLSELSSVDVEGFIRRAANEAAAVAWESRFSLLVFPILFEEKTREALAQIQRQVSVRNRSSKLLPTCCRRSCSVQMRNDRLGTNRI